ncbi:MAG: hypothetical protein HY583_01415 [Candidatus Omnitrophica bacterium]|nr:hypothetical protein [Candidatus Omnitrophota bacterium]
MKEKALILVGIIVCLSLSLALPFTVLAEDAAAPPSDQLLDDLFAQADALNYGGLLGPLQAPEEYISYTFIDGSARINTREMGFLVDEPHYTPIAKRAEGNPTSGK